MDQLYMLCRGSTGIDCKNAYTTNDLTKVKNFIDQNKDYSDGRIEYRVFTIPEMEEVYDVNCIPKIKKKT